jgi:hypothetical protein
MSYPLNPNGTLTLDRTSLEATILLALPHGFVARRETLLTVANRAGFTLLETVKAIDALRDAGIIRAHGEHGLYSRVWELLPEGVR